MKNTIGSAIGLLLCLLLGLAMTACEDDDADEGNAEEYNYTTAIGGIEVDIYLRNKSPWGKDFVVQFTSGMDRQRQSSSVYVQPQSERVWHYPLLKNSPITISVVTGTGGQIVLARTTASKSRIIVTYDP